MGGPREPAERPLAAVTYLLRNPRRVAPVAVVQALVTALLLTVITPTNAFETTSEAYVRVMEEFTIVTPVWRNDFDEELLALMDANRAMSRRVRAKALWMRTPMIVGEAYAPLIAIETALQPEFLERVGNRLAAGRLPETGSGGAAVHRAILRAQGLSLGRSFGQGVDPDDSTPGRFEVVGEIEGEARIGVIDLEYASDPDSVLARQPSFQVVYAERSRKAESDRWLHEARHADGRKAFRVMDEAFVRGRMEKAMENLPLVLGFVTGAVSLIVALVVSLLNLIAFQGRVDEFGLYLAVGHRRSRLATKLAKETGLTSLAGWLLGLGLGLAALAAWQRLALDPKGILMNLLDPRALWFSLAVPGLSASVSGLALTTRLRRMDPVSVIQRRGAG